MVARGNPRRTLWRKVPGRWGPARLPLRVKSAARGLRCELIACLVVVVEILIVQGR